MAYKPSGRKSFVRPSPDAAPLTAGKSKAESPILYNSEDKAVALWQKGCEAAMHGHLMKGIEFWDKALKLKPDYYSALTCRGIALYELGQREEALNSYDKAIELNPSDALSWNGRGNALYELGQKEEALNSYNKAIKLNPDFYMAWNGRGNALYELGQKEEALNSYDKAIKLDSDFYTAWYNRGNALSDVGRKEDAIANYDKAIERNSEYHLAWYNRANALYDVGRKEDAIASHDKAIELKPDYYFAWCNRGVVLSSLGRKEDAIASYDKAIELKPDYYFAWQNRATAICNIAGRSSNYSSFLSSFDLSNIQAFQASEPHLAALEEAIPHFANGSYGWAYIHRALGDETHHHSKTKQNPLPYWRDARRSYHSALSVFNEANYPEDYLKTLQGLIRIELAFEDIPTARSYQQKGYPVFEKLRAQQTAQLKPGFERKFSSFVQQEIDLLIGENSLDKALEQAEFYKNRCLTWILDTWTEHPSSPTYPSIQSLLKPDTAIIYWHLSQERLTTFLLLSNQSLPFVLDTDRLKQAQKLSGWLKTYNREYRSYAGKKRKHESENAGEKRKKHPWRTHLSSLISQLKQILKVEDIYSQLPSEINHLILIPHRDLHRLSLHSLFPDRFTITYLPSAQIGLTLQQQESSSSESNSSESNSPESNNSLAPLLNLDDPNIDQPWMKYARAESEIVRHLTGQATHLAEDVALAAATAALQENYHTFHFTGHGEYNPRQPEKSALQLTDGHLTAKTLSNLELSSYSLICLASCETALTGTETIVTEYVGLASAVLKAGATNVLSTLWQVDEIPSAWFMIRFYQALTAGDSPAVALKTAQQWVRSVTPNQLISWLHQLCTLPGLSRGTLDTLNTEASVTAEDSDTMQLDQPLYSHPIYWAGFTLTGKG